MGRQGAGLMARDKAGFDQDHEAALRRIWFLGDVHGHFRHIADSLLSAIEPPRWLVFLGDIDIDHEPFRVLVLPLTRLNPALRVAFIHGNHDADTHTHWAMLHDCGQALALHGRVLDLDGVRVAGLGGTFLGRVWMPPAAPLFETRQAAMAGGAYRFRDGQRPSPKLQAAIYPSEYQALARLRADILVTHEAPSCHPHGFAALDALARSLQVVRTFHGHHHDDLSDAYAPLASSLQFDAKGVDFCGIKDGLGRVVRPGEAGW